MAKHKARTYPAILRKGDKGSSTEASLLTPTPYLGFTGTDQERRGFEYFRWETEQQVGQALNLDHAHRLILQSSHSNDAVRSAVIALGSITEQHQVNSILAFDQEQANNYHEFAQAQYYHALKQLREQIANAPHCSENLAIISCFLFTLFEFMQGNDTASMVHLRSGLNMLRRQVGPPDLLRQELLRIFSIMDLQATLWMDLKSVPAFHAQPDYSRIPSNDNRVFFRYRGRRYFPELPHIESVALSTSIYERTWKTNFTHYSRNKARPRYAP